MLGQAVIFRQLRRGIGGSSRPGSRFQNFSVPLTRRLNCLISDSTNPVIDRQPLSAIAWVIHPGLVILQVPDRLARPPDTDRWASPLGSPPAVSSPPGPSATPPARRRLAPASRPWPSRDTDSQTAAAPTAEGLCGQIDIGQDVHEIDDRLERREVYAVKRPDPRPAVTQEGARARRRRSCAAAPRPPPSGRMPRWGRGSPGRSAPAVRAATTARGASSAGVKTVSGSASSAVGSITSAKAPCEVIPWTNSTTLLSW